MTVDAPAPATRRDRSHILYISVLVAMALGIAVGFLSPSSARTCARWVPDSSP
jgi:aerobic C4-dicarboxylate transport protein